MSISSNTNGNTLTISVPERFNFSCHKSFRDAYASTDGSSTTYVVDLSATEYIDSSALGMLLLLREYSGSNQGSVIIKGANANVEGILVVSNFNKLFTLQ